MIRRSKNNDNRPDFDDVMNDVEQDVQADKAEQELDDRILIPIPLINGFLIIHILGCAVRISYNIKTKW